MARGARRGAARALLDLTDGRLVAVAVRWARSPTPLTSGQMRPIGRRTPDTHPRTPPASEQQRPIGHTFPDAPGPLGRTFPDAAPRTHPLGHTRSDTRRVR